MLGRLSGFNEFAQGQKESEVGSRSSSRVEKEGRQDHNIYQSHELEVIVYGKSWGLVVFDGLGLY
jgi:hypothetical protein